MFRSKCGVTLVEAYERLTGKAAVRPASRAELDAVDWTNKGISLDTLERLEEALSCYDRALELNPHFEWAWNNKGAVLDKLGRLEQALACYDRVLEMNPRNEKA